MDQRIQEQHGSLGTDQGRTAAYDEAATARAHAPETDHAAEHGSATSDQPDGDAAYFDTAGANQGGEGDDAAAADGASAADAPAGNGRVFFPEVLAGLKAAEANAHEAGRQALVRAYEDLRGKAVGNLEIMLAHAQLVHAASKWDPEDFATVSVHLAQADRCLAVARDAVLARMQIVELDEAARAAREAPSA